MIVFTEGSGPSCQKSPSQSYLKALAGHKCTLSVPTRNTLVVEQVGFVACCDEGDTHHRELGETWLKGVGKNLL